MSLALIGMVAKCRYASTEVDDCSQAYGRAMSHGKCVQWWAELALGSANGPGVGVPGL
eukprot:COSAG01_NODE_594_length_15086_cov_39.948805_6_plen_58_part_00